MSARWTVGGRAGGSLLTIARENPDRFRWSKNAVPAYYKELGIARS